MLEFSSVVLPAPSPYLTSQKKNKILPGSQFLLPRDYRAHRAQNLPGSVPDNVLQSAPDFIQIGSLLAQLYQNAWTPSKSAVKCFQYSAEASIQDE